MISKMPGAAPPIPQLIPPLKWRAPALIWTPAALTLAIGWPAALLSSDSGAMHGVLVAGAATFALALVSLGASWAIGRPPRTHRAVILHVLIAGALVAVAAPFVLVGLIEIAAASRTPEDDVLRLPFSASLSMIPLTLLVGLPTALFSGIVFAVVALVKPQRDDQAGRADMQPFA